MDAWEWRELVTLKNAYGDGVRDAEQEAATEARSGTQ